MYQRHYRFDVALFDDVRFGAKLVGFLALLFLSQTLFGAVLFGAISENPGISRLSSNLILNNSVLDY